MRTGFEDKYYTELIGSLGISLFLLFTPLVLRYYFRAFAFLECESLVGLLLLIILCFAHFIPYAAYAIFFLGSISFLVCCYFFWSLEKLSLKLVVGVFMAFYFGIWTLFTLWTVHRPTLFETIAVNREVFQAQDLFFHSAISHIIKNYKTASTGLQGTPYIYYHSGSHWILAQISKLTDFHILRVYNIFYPLVIVPFFFKTFFTFSADIGCALNIKRGPSFLSMAVLFCLFLGIPDHWYSKGFYDGSILVLESLVFSLLFSFILGSIWIYFLGKHELQRRHTVFGKVFIFGFSPLLFWAIGMIKISTLFVLIGVFFCIIIAFGLWRQKIGLSFWITLIGSCVVYFLVVETIPFGIRSHGDEGQINPGAFYSSMNANKLFHPFYWFGLFFLWTYIIVMIVSVLKIKRPLSSGLNQKGLTLILIISSAASIVGLAPSIILSFNGANAIFFVTIQMYLSGCFLMALAPTLQSYLEGKRLLMIGFFVSMIFLFAFIHISIRGSVKDILLENLNTRIRTTDPMATSKDRFSLNDDIKLISSGFPSLSQKIKEVPLYELLKNLELMGLKNDTARSKTLMFVDDYVLGKPIGGTENLNCLEKTFLVPALSGYAVLNGAIYNCSIGSYGASYYSYPGNKQDTAVIKLCDEAVRKGFTRILYYNASENSERIIECR